MEKAVLLSKDKEVGKRICEGDITIYSQIALDTGVFNSWEIDTLKEILNDYLHNPLTSYSIFEEKNIDVVEGFIIFGRTPLTKFTWDIYWLVVAKEFQNKGVGKNLIKRVENFVLEIMPKAVLRIETSADNRYSAARHLYLKCGFKEIGRIPDFYADANDLIIYSKEIDIWQYKGGNA
ncbi:MAG: GNAT family N-acetyltransferase [Candidatus Omnitrophica bacterium]|nr:GNAT family N-acetyltransferase [Candidatus Omnitrophota bacterium]